MTESKDPWDVDTDLPEPGVIHDTTLGFDEGGVDEYIEEVDHGGEETRVNDDEPEGVDTSVDIEVQGVEDE